MLYTCIGLYNTRWLLRRSMSIKLANPTASITLPFRNNNPSNIRLKYHSLLCKAINLDPRVRAGGWLYTLIQEWTVINSNSISFSLFLDKCSKIILCHIKPTYRIDIMNKIPLHFCLLYWVKWIDRLIQCLSNIM